MDHEPRVVAAFDTLKDGAAWIMSKVMGQADPGSSFARALRVLGTERCTIITAAALDEKGQEILDTMPSFLLRLLLDEEELGAPYRRELMVRMVKHALDRICEEAKA